MGTDFEKMMNDKMENASLHDVLPGFDKDQAWDELSEKLPAKKKRRVVPVWWTHAAAVVAGVLIGSVAITTILNNDDKQAEQQVTIANKPVAPQVIVKTDTVYVTKEVEVPVVQPVAAPLQPVQKQQVVVAQQKEVAQPVKKKDQAPAIVTETLTEEKTVIAKAPVKKVKPVHLLDIENEDRNTALYQSDPSAKVRSGFALQISAERLPASNQHASSIFHGFKKSK